MLTTSQPLAQQVYDAIFHHPNLNHHKMQVQASDGKVKISGLVSTFFEKQMAQEAIRNLDGVDLIENDLEVDKN